MSAPPVAFVSQIGEGGKSWQPVVERLTCGSSVIVYDRPGTGDAPPRPAPNPPLPYSVFADELAALLDQRGVTGPAVIVGHSIGSLIVRVFAARYPNRVAGLVFVDGSIPQRSLGHGLYVDEGEEAKDGDGPDATAFDSLRGETEVVEAVLPAVPAAVITRTWGRWSPWVRPQLEPAADALWLAYQRQLSGLLGAPLIVALGAGHQIPNDAPGLVAYVVDRVTQAAQVGGSVVLDEEGLDAAGGAVSS